MLIEYNLASLSLVAYFVESDFAGKLIVLVLLACSFMAWTVMIGKYLDLQRTRKLNLTFEARLYQKGSVLDLVLDKTALSQGAYSALAYNALEAYKRSLHANTYANSKDHMLFVENALQRTVAKQTLLYESKMVLLASTVSGAPFLGLLGTVWGVMDAFGGLGSQTSATIQSLAPGISGALLTTVAGLLVAIPSVFGYNFLLTQTKMMVIELENFASWFADKLQREICTLEREPYGQTIS